MRHFDRAGSEQLFERTGLGALSASLHKYWNAPQSRGRTRLDAISSWLSVHHEGQTFAILDDHVSGTVLRGSVHDRVKRVVLCEVGVGLHAEHLTLVRQALGSGCGV